MGQPNPWTTLRQLSAQVTCMPVKLKRAIHVTRYNTNKTKTVIAYIYYEFFLIGNIWKLLK